METDKAALRAQLRAARARRPAHDHAAVADAVRDHLLALPVLGSARRVATYLALPTEPSLAPLHEVLLGRGTEVVVPVVVDGESLDWVALTPGDTFTAGRLGILEPSGPRLGPGALAGVDLVLAPALAVDHAGHRLG
ncbi:MAG: 5-formyltetrahydrofolate cyclo-ligase, partial [Actinomycetales bacterium]